MRWGGRTDMAHSLELSQRDRAAIIRLARESPALPGATYRLQFHASFPFAAARAIVPYLAKLGITHIYASPIWTAISGSLHGYDIIDFSRINEELGGRVEFDALVEELVQHGMGLILDFVPNHMGIGGGLNPWWQDVLENGRVSPYASYFDIDWQPLKSELQDQVLVPVLGDQFGIVLERGELHLRFDDGAFFIDYYGTPFPIAPPTYPLILRPLLAAVATQYHPDDLPLLELESINGGFERLRTDDELEETARTERLREQIINKRRLGDLLRREAPMRDALESVILRIDGIAGKPVSFDTMEILLEAQPYRLAYWKVAAEEINYRRFFAINELAALRQEEPAVFEATHRLLFELIANHETSGVRIDHLDGLWNPLDYLHQLQYGIFLARARKEIDERRVHPMDAELWQDRQRELRDIWDTARADGNSNTPFYIVVEKILEPGEELSQYWPIAGTVGYEFARLVTGLFADSAHRRVFDQLYQRFTGEQSDIATVIYEQKKRIMRVALASEVNVMVRALDRLTEQNRRTRDYTLNNLRDAMREIIACFPVYRTYITCEQETVGIHDRRFIDEAVDQALRRNPESDPGVYEFIRTMLLLHYPPEATENDQMAICRFVMKFQQLTGPVMAKGVEDTAFYRYNRLISLNEVGSDPGVFGIPAREFHRQCIQRAKQWPTAMLASSTHDTKRSEDARARISALSEMPRAWRAAVNRWAKMNRTYKTRLRDGAAPSRNDEYFFYQSLIGIWPFEDEPLDDAVGERLRDSMIKAIREAQAHTSWINPNESYENAVTAFVNAVLASGPDNQFLNDLRQFVQPIMRIGVFTALSQQLLKLTAPGVPDLYQGSEFWDLSLVDPDNRRPVDFVIRIAAMDQLANREPSVELATELLTNLSSGFIKLWLTHRALVHRAEHTHLYTRGSYTPLQTTGPRAKHLVVFRRDLDRSEAIVIAPRLIGGLLDQTTTAPIGECWKESVVVLDDDNRTSAFRNVFTGEIVPVIETAGGNVIEIAVALKNFPVALLDRIPRESTTRRRERSHASK